MVNQVGSSLFRTAVQFTAGVAWDCHRFDYISLIRCSWGVSREVSGQCESLSFLVCKKSLCLLVCLSLSGLSVVVLVWLFLRLMVCNFFSFSLPLPFFSLYLLFSWYLTYLLHAYSNIDEQERANYWYIFTSAYLRVKVFSLSTEICGVRWKYFWYIYTWLTWITSRKWGNLETQ